MTAARDCHTSTLLPNGLVLIAGGCSASSNPLPSSAMKRVTIPLSMVYGSDGAVGAIQDDAYRFDYSPGNWTPAGGETFCAALDIGDSGYSPSTLLFYWVDEDTGDGDMISSTGETFTTAPRSRRLPFRPARRRPTTASAAPTSAGGRLCSHLRRTTTTGAVPYTLLGQALVEVDEHGRHGYLRGVRALGREHHQRQLVPVGRRLHHGRMQQERRLEQLPDRPKLDDAGRNRPAC